MQSRGRGNGDFFLVLLFMYIFVDLVFFFRYRVRSSPSCAETLPRRRVPLPQTGGVRRVPPQFPGSRDDQQSLSTRAGALLRVRDSDCGDCGDCGESGEGSQGKAGSRQATAGQGWDSGTWTRQCAQSR